MSAQPTAPARSSQSRTTQKNREHDHPCCNFNYNVHIYSPSILYIPQKQRIPKYQNKRGKTRANTKVRTKIKQSQPNSIRRSHVRGDSAVRPLAQPGLLPSTKKETAPLRERTMAAALCPIGEDIAGPRRCSGELFFHSDRHLRSRARLWVRGESPGSAVFTSYTRVANCTGGEFAEYGDKYRFSDGRVPRPAAPPSHAVAKSR